MNADRPLLAININVASDLEVDENLLRDLLDFAYRSKRRKPAELDILVADDAEMTGLNRRHLGKNEPTDVLAFEDGEEGEDGGIRLGDIAVGAETARRVALERGGEFRLELAFYALHGLFHLLGMDDAADADREAMLRLQEKTMREYGLDLGKGLE